jgi:tetrahydromethanopterin S-methyltransferase subunit H
MFMFEKEQVIHNVGGVNIGGTPGETPTVLIGTIFYSGHKIVENAKRGIIDTAAAKALIRKQDELAGITGNPSMVQIFSESEVAMQKYIDLIVDVTDSPFLIDSTEPMVRIAGLRYAEEVGLLDRAVYNSINVSASDGEMQALAEIQHECAIILAFNPQDPSIAGRRLILDEGALELKKGLLPLSRELGVTKPLIDTATTAMGAGAGSAAAFTFVSKTVYGLPTGSGGLRNRKKANKEAYRVCDAASNLIVQMMGADFLLYGPIGSAERVFPAVAMADIFAAEAASLEFGTEPSADHPFKRLL